MAFAPAVWLAVQHEFFGSDDADEPSPYASFDDFDDDALFKMFHLTRPCINFITDNVRLRMKTLMLPVKPGLSVEGMVMATLNFYAHGISSTAVQERVGITHTESPEIICRISKILADMATQFITFPFTREDMRRTTNEMEKFCGIPGVLGVLGCGHFKIRAPTVERKAFLNSWGAVTVMTQFICDCYGNIMSVEKCCVGSTREQQMWESSFKGREMQGDMYGKSWVIGGKGYCLSKHVLTAVSKPATNQESAFNEAHTKALRVMQKMFDTMRRRFQCLMHLGFVQQGSLDKRFDIIKACCVLHNVAKKFSVPPLASTSRTEPLQPVGFYQMPETEARSEAEKARQAIISGFKVPAPPTDQEQDDEDSPEESKWV